jgi:hypothetical protein
VVDVQPEVMSCSRLVADPNGALHHSGYQRVWPASPYPGPAMSLTRFLPHEVRRNVAGAIYGVILGSSIIAAAGADHPRQAGLVEIYLCVTALVFYLAHVYARVLGSWIEGETPSASRVRKELVGEWPMVRAQMLPALVLLLGALGWISGRWAISLAMAVALAELMAGVVLACRKAGATRSQATISISAAALFALVVVFLKVYVHG